MVKYVRVCLAYLFVAITVVAVSLWKGSHTFVFAWITNFALMIGVFYHTHTLKPPLTSNYFNAAKWEAKGSIYKWFGVNVFRKILVWVGWEKLNKAANPVKNSLEALKRLEYGTRQSEFGHLIIFFIILIINLFVAFYYGVTQSLSLLFLNIILNVYPVILQRYNRPRLQKAIQIRQAIK